MNALVERGLVEKEKQTALLNNELVLIVQKGSAASVSSFSDVAKEELKKVAVGQPETVPAGTYAKQTFTRLGLWEQLQDKVVFTKDVRQVLTYVETGNTEAGVVYKTDALSSDKVEIAATADAATHEPIVYPLGIVQATKHPRETEALYQWLQGEEAKQIFAKYGFQTAAK
jgi:molybdate transport system substrate-binding protein